MHTSQNAEVKRFEALTGFRALAAILIFIFHNRKYWRSDIHPELLRLINEFHVGVSLFFVLSGFLIAYTYHDKPLKSSAHYFRYILLRAARILPLYWLILTAYYFDPKYADDKLYFLTYSLAHGFSDQYNLTGLAQAWSLNVEFVFYILAPFLCLLHHKHLKWLIMGILVLFGFFWGLGVCWHNLNGNPHSFFYPMKFLLSSSFPGRATEFVAGMILAKFLLSGGKLMMSHKTFIGFTGIFFVAYCIGFFQPDVYHQGTEHPIGLLLHMLILPIFVALTLVGLMTEHTWIQSIFSSKILILLGNASFAFYLIHISYINLRIKSIYLGPDRNFIILWIISIVLYKLFENPVYQFARKALKRA